MEHARRWLAPLAAGALLAGADAAGEAVPDRAALQGRAVAVFGVLPGEATSAANPSTGPKIALGRMLFYEPRLSLNQEISCNSCHRLDRFGVDGEPTSPGHEGVRGDRNSPSVYNAAFHVAQFWDGRAPDVEEQAKGPILNPIEMGMPSGPEAVDVLGSIPGYLPLFREAFPGEEGPITYDNAVRAIGAFERRLVTPGRFDAFLAGDLQALDGAELLGLSTFMDTGCITCHNGATVGGGMFQKLGLVKPYPVEDPGRFRVTGNEQDRQVFKVPSLRNVAETGPWFHDGSVRELERAIRIMAEHQLGRTLDDGQVASIRAFLGSLTGRVDEAYVAPPELPESGPATPGPR